VKASGLGRFALGQPMPNRDHAVCVSLPTYRDLIGYEEKDPAVYDSMRSGYPRFVRHHLISKLIRFLDSSEPEKQWDRFLFSDHQSCREAIRHYAINKFKIMEHGGFTSLQVVRGSEDASSIGAFLQHTGCGISSRQAESHLFEIGELEKRESLSQNEDPARKVKRVIAKAHGPQVSENDVLLGSSGANAFYSFFRTACEDSRAKGKSVWIRLGWLYLDTIEVMNLLAGDESGNGIPNQPTPARMRVGKGQGPLHQSEGSPRYRSDHDIPQERKGIGARRRRDQQFDQVCRVRGGRNDGKPGLPQKFRVGT